MPRTRTHRPARSAFTLIELLIVIAIIALLVALSTAAVMKALEVARRSETSTEVTKLDAALKVAMQRYSNTNSLPSRLILHNDLSKYSYQNPGPISPLEKRSAEALRKMFGPRFLTTVNPNTGIPLTDGNGKPLWPRNTGPTAWTGWDGTGNMANSFTLEGQQCLVFYLGGVTTTTPARACLGFSSDPLNPMLATGDNRIGPFFEFKQQRLLPGNTSNPNPNTYGTNAFFVYLDAYHPASDPLAKPFAYFSSTTATNTYNPYYNAAVPALATSDCQSLGVWPYIESAGNYINPSGFQIISAGLDGVFGVGGGPPGSPPTFSNSVYDPATGARDAATRDNQSNFSQSVLASPRS